MIEIGVFNTYATIIISLYKVIKKICFNDYFD